MTLKDKESKNHYRTEAPDTFFYSEDVKEAVLEFEKFVFKIYGKKFEINAFEFSEIMTKYKEIFGDFTNETNNTSKENEKWN